MAIAAYVLIIVSFVSMSFSYAENVDGKVIANPGILRAIPDFEGEVVQNLSIGTKVIIQDENDLWYKVMLKGLETEGWIYKELVIKNDENMKVIKKGIVTVEGSLNLRSMPSTEGNIISRLSNETELIVLEEMGDWLQVQLHNGVKGFVHSDYVNIVPNYPHGKIIVTNSNIYATPDLDSQVINSISIDTNVYIKDYDHGRYNILTEDFLEGWVNSEDVELNINVLRPVSRSGSRTHPLAGIKSVAEKYLGKPYRYGANGPNSFDCSGFVTYIFNTYYKDYLNSKGISLPRTSRDLAQIGTRIKREQLQVGDLVFFNNGKSTTISHTGIYIGNNEFIHASSTTGNAKVIISPLNTGHYNTRYSTAVRL